MRHIFAHPEIKSDDAARDAQEQRPILDPGCIIEIATVQSAASALTTIGTEI